MNIDDWNEEMERLAIEEADRYEIEWQAKQARKERIEEWLADRGPVPRITRRWPPRLDVHVRLQNLAKPERHPDDPWRIDLPVGTKYIHTEFAPTLDAALAIAEWWVAGTVRPDGVILGTEPIDAPMVHRIPRVTNTEQENDSNDDL